jgi:hypothetical protein
MHETKGGIMGESEIGMSRWQVRKGPGMGRRRVAMLALALVSPAAGAVEFDAGFPNVKMSWNNMLKYSAGWRVRSPIRRWRTTPSARGRIPTTVP